MPVAGYIAGKGTLRMTDPLLLLGTFMLGMALGAVTTMIRYKTAVSWVVKTEIENASRGASPEEKKLTDSNKPEAA